MDKCTWFYFSYDKLTCSGEQTSRILLSDNAWCQQAKVQHAPFEVKLAIIHIYLPKVVPLLTPKPMM